MHKIVLNNPLCPPPPFRGLNLIKMCNISRITTEMLKIITKTSKIFVKRTYFTLILHVCMISVIGNFIIFLQYINNLALVCFCCSYSGTGKLVYYANFAKEMLITQHDLVNFWFLYLRL